MKVILLKDIKKQGKKGDILELKNGYANFLISNKEAVPATNNSLSRLDKENEEKRIIEQNKIKECQLIKENIEKHNITFQVKTGEYDRVFGSISPKQIVDELKKIGFNIDKKQINIISPISSLGFHNVEINLHKSVKANLKIEVKK